MITEVLPLLDLHLGQLVVYEDQDRELAPELFRVDVNKLWPIPGLVHPYHGEVGEGVHHWHALARFSASVRRKEEEEASENIFWELSILNAGDEL